MNNMNMNMTNPMNSFSNPNYSWNSSNQFSYPSPYNYYNQHNNNSISQPPQQASNNIVWVKGKENARSMQLPPNSTVVLLDSEVGKFYIKTTADIGLGKLRIFSYTQQPDIDAETEIKSNTSLDLSNYVTKNEFQQAIKEIRKYEQSLSTAEQPSKKQQFKTTNKQF